jgi:hypothetical protein
MNVIDVMSNKLAVARYDPPIAVSSETVVQLPEIDE